MLTRAWIVEQFNRFLTYLLNILLGYVTPQMYGAKGDGITDDTEAIQRAMASDYVYFPQGTYLCSKQMVLHSNQKVLGAGKDLVKVIFTSNGLSTGQTYTRGRVVTGISDYRYNSTKASNIHLEGMTIDSTYIVHDPSHPVDTGTVANAIITTDGKTLLLLTNCDNVTIKNVKVSVSQLNDEASAFKSLVNTQNVLIEDCDFEQLQEYTTGSMEVRNTPFNTGYADTENITFRNCSFYRKGGIDEIMGIYGSYSASLEIQALVKNVLFEGCKFKSDVHESESGRDEQYLISISYGSVDNITFRNCFIEDNNSQTATFKRHPSTEIAIDSVVVLDGCTVKHNTTGSVLLVETVPTEKQLISFENGRIILENGLVSGNYRSQIKNTEIIANNSTNRITNSGVFDGCTIQANDSTALSTGVLAEFKNCVVNYSATGDRLLLQAKKIVNCIFNGGKVLAIQMSDSNTDIDIQYNIFSHNMRLSDTSNGKTIKLVGNIFQKDMTLNSLVDNSLVAYIVESNMCLGTPTNLATSYITKTYGNSFDTSNYVTMAEVQAYVEELLNRNNGNDAV